MAARCRPGLAGASAGKKDSTASSSDRKPSAAASPAAVAAKLLESEYSRCGAAGRYGSHHPSATTCPRRASIKLCSPSARRSASSTKASTALEDIPCASGVLRGSASPPGADGGAIGSWVRTFSVRVFSVVIGASLVFPPPSRPAGRVRVS